MAAQRITTRRIIKRANVASTDEAEIPLFMVAFLAAVASACLSSIWIVPAILVQLHDVHFKPYLNALRWNETELWALQSDRDIPMTPWKHDWFSCSEDPGAGPIVESFNPLYDKLPATSAEAVDSVLYHGMTVLPQAMPKPLAENMKDFVLNRNEYISVMEAIPVLTHSSRKSFGLDLREDESIAVALNALASNALLTQTLEALLGPNPSIVELSTITAQPGAKAQPWHADSNPNTMIYERHFTQVFTVLIPLQDTTFEMGATWVCPGTNRCQPHWGYCDKHGYSVATANRTSGSPYWKAGDALLYSSDTHHRGGAHVDWDGPPRTVLILSLTSRPVYHVSSSGKPIKWLSPRRTLPLGPVFGIRYDHWGLTWKHFQDKEQIENFKQQIGNGLVAFLRALGLYSLEHDEGWTFAQSVSFGMVNDMMGYRFMDLEAFIKYRVSPFLSGLPWFLQGRIQPLDDDYTPWPRYLSDTGRNLRNGAVAINLLVALAVLVAYVKQLSQSKGGTTGGEKTGSGSLPASRRKTQSLGVVIGVFAVVYLCATVFGGLVWLSTSNKLNVIFSHWHAAQAQTQENNTPMASENPNGSKIGPPIQVYLESTTSAGFHDVMLVDHATLHESDLETDLARRWVDYYPGTLRWKSAVRDQAITWWNYHGLPRIFSQAILRHIIETNDNSRTFVKKNKFGNWEKVVESEAMLATENALMDWWTLHLTPQRWGAPVLLHKRPCSLPRAGASRMCQSNSAELLLRRTVFPSFPASKEPARLCRRQPAHESSSMENSIHEYGKLAINDRIEARYHQGKHWVEGKVAQIYEIGAKTFYDVQFGYWGFHQMIPEELVRRKKAGNMNTETTPFYQLETASSRQLSLKIASKWQPRVFSL